MVFNPAGYEWWEYFIMPWMAGVIGWATNVLALEMTFGPIEFFGIEWLRNKNQPWGLFGWQGIIPTKAKKMASVTFDLMTKKLIDPKELFIRLEPSKFAEEMENGLLLLIDNTIEEVATQHLPSVWSQLPQEVKDEIVVLTNSACPEFLSAVISDVQNNVENFFDIKEMCISSCVEHKDLVVKIFKEVGDKVRIFPYQYKKYLSEIQITVFVVYSFSKSVLLIVVFSLSKLPIAQCRNLFSSGGRDFTLGLCLDAFKC